MLDKLLEEVVVSVVGKSATGIVDLLNTPKYVNEFVLAKKLGITINQTRNILYKISDFGLVSSVRKKDKKKGWYTYYWRFEILKCLEFLRDHLVKTKKEIQNEIALRNSKTFYICESCNLEYGEDQAILMDFTCDECGQVFTIRDNSKLIKDLEKSISKIDEKLDVVNLELEKEQAKLTKKKDIEMKKEEKEKQKKKEEEKKKRAKLKKEKEKFEAKSKGKTSKAAKIKRSSVKVQVKPHQRTRKSKVKNFAKRR
jgi:transcription factor E